jgi:hypothetical protein
MLTKDIIIGVVTVHADNRLEVREDVIIYEEGKEISRTVSWYALLPGDEIDNKPPRVKDIAGAIWTPEMIKARFDKLKEPIEVPAPISLSNMPPFGLAIPTQPEQEKDNGPIK